jgi:hypothetical protein
MKNKKGKLFINLLAAVIIATTPIVAYCSESDPIDSLNVSNYYRRLSIGLNIPTYRDFATSPLFYNGYGILLQTSWFKNSIRRERDLQIGLTLNNMSARIPKSNYIQPKTNAVFAQLNIRYNRLFQLKSISNEKVNYKLGGLAQTTQNFRINQNLQNNAIGLENITNLMVSAQMTRDVSRNRQRTFNFGLFKIRRSPVKRDLRFQLNYGIANFNYRPGYAYTYVPEINGSETSFIKFLRSSYKWSYFDGQRLNTDLEFIIYLPNGNATSWSYTWDIAHVPGNYQAFQMASHQIRYRLYFHAKKR